MKRLLLVFAVWGTWASCQPDILGSFLWLISCIHEVIPIFIQFMAGNAPTQQKQEMKNEKKSSLLFMEHLLM